VIHCGFAESISGAAELSGKLPECMNPQAIACGKLQSFPESRFPAGKMRGIFADSRTCIRKSGDPQSK